MFWVFVVVLWAAMLISPFILLYLFLPAGKDCPRCSTETVAIRSRWLWPARRIAGLRWCMSCGWEGVARSPGARRPVAELEAVPDEVEEADDDAPWRTR
jgi:hypothetical protein